MGLIDELLSSIGHVHVHDNHGGVGVADDLHLPIGDGIIDFSGILESLIKRRYNGTITLELEKKDIKSSWERIRQMVNTIETGLHQF
jgi:sugar phosphate isomerase/epimerase